MTSNRPYLIRAFYDWIVDNQYTPYMSVDAFYPGVEVPQDYVSDGQIVLNLVPRAITDLVMSNQEVISGCLFNPSWEFMLEKMARA